MPVAYWRNEYSTGYQQVDQEHQELFAIVNALHDALMRGEDRSVLREIIEQLANQTVKHFHNEDELMRIHHYPGFNRHKKRHNELSKKVQFLVQQVNDPEASLTVDLTHFLTEWIIHHIKGEDQKMTQFFREKIENEKSILSTLPENDFLSLPHFLNLELVDYLAPKHNQVSCSDGETLNGWTSHTEPPLCDRCALLQSLRSSSWPQAFKISIHIERNHEYR